MLSHCSNVIIAITVPPHKLDPLLRVPGQVMLRRAPPVFPKVGQVHAPSSPALSIPKAWAAFDDPGPPFNPHSQASYFDLPLPAALLSTWVITVRRNHHPEGKLNESFRCRFELVIETEDWRDTSVAWFGHVDTLWLFPFMGKKKQRVEKVLLPP